jgi:hypothetical protein
MSDKKPINEQDLDALLRDLFLDENSGSQHQQDANFVLAQEYGVEIDASKEQEMVSRLQQKPRGFGNTGLFLSVAAAGLVSILGIYLFSTYTTPAKTPPATQAENTLASGDAASSSTSAPEGLNPDGPNLSMKVADTFDRPNNTVLSAAIEDSLRTKHTPAKQKDMAIIKIEKAEKHVPVLTEKDRLKYKGIKQQMIASLVKLNKSLYTKIPAYKTIHAGESVILDGFAIRNVGITNLEYKAFLADLLASNRNEDYLTCEVHTENWTKHGCYKLANDYFQEKTYNDFPVVNISYEAAKLFCRWLEEETGDYIRQNNLKLKSLRIRLPYDEEWVFSAREGYAKIAFEKGYNTIYDESAGLVNRAFTNRVELVKKHAERVDTLYSYYATNRYGWAEKDMTDFFATGLNYYSWEPADTILAERMKVLGKFGHVSEMVPQKNNHKLWLSGLSWKNKEEYQKLEQEFKSNASSPFVGFRIIVINPNDPEYKNPFW